MHDHRARRGGKPAPYTVSGAGAAAIARATTSPKSGLVAASLSFIFPGAGQAYIGSWYRAAFFALPFVTIISALITLALGGVTRLALMMFDAGFATTVLAVVVLTGVWRVWAIVDAYRLVPPVRARRAAIAPIAVLVVLSLIAHGGAAWYAVSFATADSQIFRGATPPATAGPAGAAATPSGSASSAPSASSSLDPFTGVLPSPAATSSRVTFLLLGADSGMGYDHALTDSQIVVSIDRVAKTVVMASVPRDLAQFPMYTGGTYNGKINSLMTAAAADPAHYPDGGIGTLAREIGYLLGIKINYYAFVNLSGFAKIISAVGGVDVVNPAPINDPGYQFPDGKVGFFMAAGPQHLDSRSGLAFVRTRMGVGDNDYTRARRQQLVLQALRQKLTSPTMLPQLPGLLGALAQTVQTDFPPSQLADMVALSQSLPSGSITQEVLGPPFAVNPPLSQTGGVWILMPDMRLIQKWSARVFGQDSAFYVAPAPSPSASPAASPSGQ